MARILQQLSATQPTPSVGRSLTSTPTPDTSLTGALGNKSKFLLPNAPKNGVQTSTPATTANTQAGTLSDVAKSFAGGVVDTAKGAFGDVAKFGISALAAPIDIARQTTGRTPLMGTYKLPGFEPQQTFQAEARNARVQAEQGKGSTLSDIGLVAGPVLAGASLLGAPESLLTKDTLKTAVKGTVEDVVSGASKLKGKIITSPAEKTAQEVSKIQETIMPKPTVKEARLALKEGRLVKGKEPTIFKSGTEDTVLPSKSVVRASQTIQREIPNASKMSEDELYLAAGDKVTDIAKKLQPEMKKVQIDKTITGKAFDKWKTLSESQKNDAEFVDNEAGNIKLQNQFESRLKDLQWDIIDPKTGKFQSPTPKTLDDVWKAAKDYDASVPENIKKANSMSDSKLQYRKQMWLDNRAIFRDLINDASTGLGNTSKQAFSDMTDLYTAMENIISKAKIEKPKPSKIKEFSAKHPYITGTVVGGAATATGLPKKILDMATGGAL